MFSWWITNVKYPHHSLPTHRTQIVSTPLTPSCSKQWVCRVIHRYKKCLVFIWKTLFMELWKMALNYIGMEAPNIHLNHSIKAELMNIQTPCFRAHKWRENKKKETTELFLSVDMQFICILNWVLRGYSSHGLLKCNVFNISIVCMLDSQIMEQVSPRISWFWQLMQALPYYRQKFWFVFFFAWTY